MATAHHVIVNQTASALCNPEMFPEAKLADDLMKLILYYHDQTGLSFISMHNYFYVFSFIVFFLQFTHLNEFVLHYVNLL